jgi:hypothetical protein
MNLIIYLNLPTVNLQGPVPVLLGSTKYSKHFFLLLNTTDFNKSNAYKDS